MGGKHRRPGQDDMALDGPESNSEALSSEGMSLQLDEPVRVPAATTAGYRGLVNLGSNGTAEWDGTGQIWSMKLIKSINSQWLGNNGYVSVETVLPTIIHKVTTWPEYELLRKSMEVYGQQVPVRVMMSVGEAIPARVRDGINRIALADIMGWDSMIVSTGIMETSMWPDWDNSEDGIRFHDAKAQRLGLRKNM